LNTGTKIAIGCLIAVVLAGTVAVIGLGVGAFWLKGKAESFVGEQQKIEDLKRKANANPFTRPPDGLVTEDRLLKFLDVRKRVFAVYVKHRSEFEHLNERNAQPDLGDMKNFLGVMNEVRLVQAQALADAGVSEDEYRFLVESVYKSAWASTFQKETGKQAPEAMGDAMKQAQESLRKGAELARQQGVPEVGQGDAVNTDEAQQQLDSATSGLKQLEVPQSNIDLFRKHEADIKKYSMAGLEILGF
jgi:hypothetical protein